MRMFMRGFMNVHVEIVSARERGGEGKGECAVCVYKHTCMRYSLY